MCIMHSKCQCVWGFFVSPQVTNKKAISQLVWTFIIWQLVTAVPIFMHGYHCKPRNLIILFSLMNHQFLQVLCIAASKWYTDLSCCEFSQLPSPSSIWKKPSFLPPCSPKHFSFSHPDTCLHFFWVSKFWKASDTAVPPTKHPEAWRFKGPA